MRVMRLLQNAISSYSTGNTYQLALAWLIRFRGQNVHLGGENFPNSQKSGKNSRVPCPNSAQSRLPRSSQFPNPVDILRFPESRTMFWSNPGSRNYPSRPCSTVQSKPGVDNSCSWICCRCGLPNFSSSLFDTFDISMQNYCLLIVLFSSKFG